MRGLVKGCVSFLLIVGLMAGCDSGQAPDVAKQETDASSEPVSAMEEPEASSMDSGMESATSETEPEALLAEEGVAGAGENNEGVSHYQQRHWDVAQEHFQKSVAANAELAEAHYNLALTLDKLGNHGDAANHFQMALDLAPENPSIAESEILKAHVGG